MPDRSRFVREHYVCWEIAPHFELALGRLRQTGFDLTLHAQNANIDPGSPEARQIHAELRDIALSVLPAGLRATIQPFGASLHLRRETAWAAEVDLVVEIRHREGTFDVVDAAERRITRAIGASLGRLGVPEGVFRKRVA